MPKRNVISIVMYWIIGSIIVIICDLLLLKGNATIITMSIVPFAYLIIGTLFTAVIVKEK